MLNTTHLIQSGGLLLIGIIIFAESGVLAGFFLPGDTLLFTAGFFAAQGKLPLAAILIVAAVAAIAGDNVGYEIGKRLGPRIFKKADGLLFKQSHVARAEAFYKKHGGKTIILARFLPLIRTLTPILAGVSKMPHKRFTFFNIIGASLWAGLITILGFWLGNKIHVSIDHYIIPIVIIIAGMSFLPMAFHLGKAYLQKRNEKSGSQDSKN